MIGNDAEARAAALSLVSLTLAGEHLERAELLAELCLRPHGRCLAAEELAGAVPALCKAIGSTTACPHGEQHLSQSYALLANRHIWNVT